MDESGFINIWLNTLFKDAFSIHKSQEFYIKKLRLPLYLQMKYLNDKSLPVKKNKQSNVKSEKSEKDENDEEEDEEDEEDSKIRSVVKIIGFNGRRFDVNFLKEK
jgi:hypothetical protein